MSRIPLAAALLFTSTTALSLRTATPGDRERIVEQIGEARRIEREEVARARAIVDQLNRHPDKTGLAIAERELNRAIEKRDIAYTKAIKLTLTAYDITPSDGRGIPTMPSGPGVHPLIKASSISWLVVCRERSAVRFMTATKESATASPADEDDAITIANGVTIVYPERISSPEALAHLLYHERVHFDQFTTTGVGDRLGRNEREADAWTKTRQAVATIYANRDESAKTAALRHAEKMVSESTRKASAEAFLRRASFGWHNPALHSPGITHASAESIGVIDSAADMELRAAIEEARGRARLAREKSERIAQENETLRVIAKRPPLPPELQPAPVAEPQRPPLPPELRGASPSEAAHAHKPDSSNLVRAVAVEACSPTGPRPDGLLVYIHVGLNAPSLSAERASLSGCELAVFDALVRYIRGELGAFTMSAGWLSDRTREYRASTTPIQSGPSGPDCFRGGDPFGCQPR